MVMKRNNESGYIALISVLIAGAAATAICLSLLTTGTDSQRSMLIEQQSKQARSLAIACAEEGMQVIHDNIAYSGTNSLSKGQGTCTYTVSVTTGTTRTLNTSGTVGNVVRKIQAYVTIKSTSISITSWQEVG